MTEKEALDYVKAHGADWEDRSEYVRYCGDCGNWVEVDLYCGTEDRCDSCADEAAGVVAEAEELMAIVDSVLSGK